jgi:type IV pilus assembly protein PilX
MKPTLTSHALQQGMVLVICLIMLLLLTLSGIAAIQGSALQEKMAGNSRDSEQAFLAAEAALRNGESFIVTTSEGDFTSSGTEGLYDVTGSDALPVAVRECSKWAGVGKSLEVHRRDTRFLHGKTTCSHHTG